MEDGQIILTADDGSEETFFVLSNAQIAGGNYLLVVDSLEDESEALILKEQEEDELITYDVVEDEKELSIISKYFEELLDDDFDIELE